MNGTLFEGVKQWEFEWKKTKAKLPVFYYDNTSITAIYTASTRKVRRMLPLAEMNPVELYPGRCLVAFTGFEYRKTDIDPYNEFSIAFLITFKHPQIPAATAAWQMTHHHYHAYIWQLPVTTEIARVGGCEMYGYPKFIADIQFNDDEQQTECVLSENGEQILTMSGKKIPTGRGKLTRYETYSVLEGIPLKANVLIDPLEYGQTGNSGATKLEFGTKHPIARDLRSIDISKKPVLYQYSPQTHAILFAGRNLIDS